MAPHHSIRAIISPFIRELLRDGHQTTTVEQLTMQQYGVSRRTVYRALDHVKQQLAEEDKQDRQRTFNLLKDGFLADLTLCDTKDENDEYILPLKERVSERRKVRASISDMYGFGKIGQNVGNTTNIFVIPDQRTAQLMQRIDLPYTEAEFEAEDVPEDGEALQDAPQGILESLGGE